MTQYELTGGAFNASVMGQAVSMTGVNYDSLTPNEITAASGNVNLNFSVGDALTVADANATVSDGKLVKGEGFTYGNIAVDIASVDVLGVASFNNIKGNVNPKEGYSGTGNFAVTAPGLGAGSGTVSVKKGAEENAVTQYELTGGAFNATIMGQTAIISGVNYDSTTNAFSANKGNLNLSVLGTNLDIEIINPSLSENKKFDFESATGVIPELVFADQAKMSNILVRVVKRGDLYEFDGESNFDLKGQIGGASASASGNVSISKKGQEEAQLKFKNADLALSIYGQSLQLQGLNYADGEYEVSKATAQITPPFLNKKLEASINELKINSSGYTFAKSEINTQLGVDFGILNANLDKLTIEKTGDSWIVSGDGGLSAGGTSFFGYSIPAIAGSGTLTHDFGANKTDKELKEVSATLPAIEFPGSIMPGKIGGSAEIPILPGLNAVASAGLSGNVQIPGLELRLKKNGDQIYEISAGTPEGKPATGELRAFMSVGVGTGIPLIASVSVSVGAEGTIAVGLNFNVSKEISINKEGSSINLDTKSMETAYQLTGDLSLAAFLELKATAFYFFTKSYKKELAKTTLGSFQKSDKEDFKWIKRDQPLQENGEHLDDIKKNLKVDVRSAENRIWTKDQFVSASSGWFKGERNRILVVDQALEEYDAIRGDSTDALIKVSALNKLSALLNNYLKVSDGTSSRTKTVLELEAQIQAALIELQQFEAKLIE